MTDFCNLFFFEFINLTIEIFQAIKDEGHDPDEYIFESVEPIVKKTTPKKTASKSPRSSVSISKSENDEQLQDDDFDEATDILDDLIVKDELDVSNLIDDENESYDIVDEDVS